MHFFKINSACIIIKYILDRLSGNCNNQAIFKTINDADIKAVEKFVREELSLLWHENCLELPHGHQSKGYI